MNDWGCNGCNGYGVHNGELCPVHASDCQRGYTPPAGDSIARIGADIKNPHSCYTWWTYELRIAALIDAIKAVPTQGQIQDPVIVGMVSATRIQALSAMNRIVAEIRAVVESEDQE